jgi:PBP1b-binding outer membrane lipoprotein LpoB
MKKKLLAIALASLTLASCGEEKVDTNKDYATVIRETQSSVVSELTPDFEIVKE